uniref:K Homology domain-containing protein n=1 Tax=Arion vulgaris TaxID=1028688 RepID=A0A0B6ZG00_9EUPU
MSERIIEEVVAVPEHLVERIVGENGVGLERVARYSGANVTLESSMDVREQIRYLVISGYQKQINLAKKLLNDSIVEERLSPTNGWTQKSEVDSPRERSLTPVEFSKEVTRVQDDMQNQKRKSSSLRDVIIFLNIL